MASVLFAVILAISARSIQEGVYGMMIQNVVSFYTGYLQIHEKGYWEEQTINNSLEYNEKLKSTITKQSNILGHIPRIESFVLAASDKHTKGAMLIGTDVNAEAAYTGLSDKITAGEYFDKNDESESVLVSEGLAKYLNINVGDTIVLIGQGYHGISAAGKYPIKGLIHFGSPELNERMIYLPLKSAQYFFGAPDQTTTIVLIPDNTRTIHQTKDKLQKAMGADYEVMTWETMMPELIQAIDGDRAGGMITLGVLYMVITFGIFGTVLMMLAERKHEFGVLVAIGMKKTKLAFTLIIELLFIALLGACSGMVLAFPIVTYLHYSPIQLTGGAAQSYESFGFEPVIKAAIEPALFLNQTLLVAFVVLLLSIYPFINILRMNSIKAMRS